MSPHAAPPALLSNPIHENGTFRGWPRPITSSVPKNRHFSELARHRPQDLPCQEPFSRKVLPFAGGPSMPEAIFPEGPCPSALSLRYFGTPGTKNARFAPGLHYFGTPGAVRPLIQEMQRRSRSTYDVCARSRDGYERPASNNAPGRRAFWLELPAPGALVAAGGA